MILSGRMVAAAQDVANVFDVGVSDVLNFSGEVIVVIAGLAAGYYGIKKWVKGVSTDTRTARDELRTSNGHTLGWYVEDSHKKLSEMYALSKSNQAKIDTLTQRYDEHLRGHP